MRVPKVLGRLAGDAVRGVLAGAAGVATAQLVAGLVRPEAGPLVTVGGTVVDATPTPLKEYAVRTFGTDDKLVLLLSIGAGLVAFAAAVGILAGRRRRLGMVAAGLFGVLGVAAALSRPTAQALDTLPALVGGAVAVVVLGLLFRPGPVSARSPSRPSRGRPAPGQRTGWAPAGGGRWQPGGWSRWVRWSPPPVGTP